LAFGSISHAQPNPNGPQYQVNDYWTGDQLWPDVAIGLDGRSVVTWSSEGSTGSDQSDLSIQARRWSSSGGAEGEEFQVNTFTSHQQYDSVVAIDNEGRFVVAWTSNGSSGSDDSHFSVQGQRYSELGLPDGPQFQVNSYTNLHQFEPDVGTDPNGGFVVVWRSYGSLGNDTSYSSVQARRFTSTGLPVGPEFQVNQYTSGYQAHPKIAFALDGRFVVAWSSSLSGETDTSETSVHARIFDSAGAPIANQFQVNVFTTSDQQGAAVAMEPAGNFIIVWSSDGSYGSDSSGTSIQARRYSANGTPLGSEFQVNTYSPGNQSLGSVVMDSLGGFVAAWSSATADFGDPGIRARRFRPDGAGDGPEFQVNSYTPGSQYWSSITSLPVGDLLIAFQSYGSQESDTSGNSIHVRLFDALFRDGFEAGDTMRWSSSTPREIPVR